MLVSVVVLNRGPASFAVAALRSVVEQTYDDIELLAVDAASSNASAAILRDEFERRELQRRFKGRVALTIDLQRQGVGQTLTRAIAATRGEIVCLLDADDKYAAGRIARIVDALAPGAAEWASTEARAIDANDRVVASTHPTAAYLREISNYLDQMPTAGFAFARYEASVTIGNLAFRRALFDAMGEIRNLASCQAWDFSLRALLRSEPAFIRAPLYEYRVDEVETVERTEKWRVTVDADSMLRAFFAAVRAERYANPLAPSPRNWPGAFEIAVAEGARWPYWADIR